MHDNIPYLFDCWADPVIHLLLLKFFIVGAIRWFCKFASILPEAVSSAQKFYDIVPPEVIRSVETNFAEDSFLQK